MPECLRFKYFTFLCLDIQKLKLIWEKLPFLFLKDFLIKKKWGFRPFLGQVSFKFQA